MACKCFDEIFRLSVDGLARGWASGIVDQDMNIPPGQIAFNCLFDLIRKIKIGNQIIMRLSGVCA